MAINGHRFDYYDSIDSITNSITRSAILVLPQTQKIAGGKISLFERKPSGLKSFRIQSSHFKFRIQNLRRHYQTGKFLFRIPPLVCKQQNQSVTKMFRIRHESGTISSFVNPVLKASEVFNSSMRVLQSVPKFWRCIRFQAIGIAIGPWQF